jgi:hypothetical protein
VSPASPSALPEAEAHDLRAVVTSAGGIVELTDRLLWKLTVLRLVAAADERRFVERAANEVDRAATELADAEIARDVAVERLAQRWGVAPSSLTLAAIADRAPQGVAAALRAHRRRLQDLTRELESVATETRRHVGVHLRSASETVAAMRGGAGTYGASGHTEAGDGRHRVQQAM